MGLENLEVLNVGPLGVDVEFDSRHGHVAENAVKYLAESGASTTLLNLRNVEL